MIIDGHAHACGIYSTTAALGKYLNKHNIDKVILCPGEIHSTKDYAYPMLSKIFKDDNLGYFFNKIISKIAKIKNLDSYIDEGNAKVYQMTKSLDGRIMNAYWINPNEDDCLQKMDSFYEKYGFYIIKIHQCWTVFDIESEVFNSILKWARKHDKVIFIHLYNKEEVNKFIDIANKNPSNNIITAHMIGISEMEKSLTSSNVYFDLSAPQLYSDGSLRKALNKFSSQRFIAGSDTPYGKNNLDIVRKRLAAIGLTENETNDICGNNIAQLLKL